jgi:hypothetical protein
VTFTGQMVLGKKEILENQHGSKIGTKKIGR